MIWIRKVFQCIKQILSFVEKAPTGRSLVHHTVALKQGFIAVC
jgi:hypothetical protein